MLSVERPQSAKHSPARTETWPIFSLKEATMVVPKASQGKVTEAVDAVRWTAQGDDSEAATETRRRAKLTGPDCVAFLYHVLRTDGFASPPQRVRCATTLLEAAGLLSPVAKETGLFRAEDADGAGEREAS
jgi:hypothetical protein